MGRRFCQRCKDEYFDEGYLCGACGAGDGWPLCEECDYLCCASPEDEEKYYLEKDMALAELVLSGVYEDKYDTKCKQPKTEKFKKHLQRFITATKVILEGPASQAKNKTAGKKTKERNEDAHKTKSKISKKQAPAMKGGPSQYTCSVCGLKGHIRTSPLCTGGKVYDAAARQKEMRKIRQREQKRRKYAEQKEAAGK